MDAAVATVAVMVIGVFDIIRSERVAAIARYQNRF